MMVLDAEFPSFDVVHAFSCFTLPSTKSLCEKYGLTIAEDTLDKLRRLAKVFSKCPGKLIAQFKQLLPFVVSDWVKCGCGGTCDVLTIWSRGLYAITHSRDTRHIHHMAELRFVLVRAHAYLPCTSGIEHSFALIELIFNAQRNFHNPTMEERSIRLLMAKELSEHDLHVVVTNAQKFWAAGRAGKAFRQHVGRRFDKGVKRTRVELEQGSSPSKAMSHDDGGPQAGHQLTATQWCKRFHSKLHTMVATVAASRLTSSLSGDVSALVVPEQAWSVGHAAEAKFQAEKKRKRLVEAETVGLTLPSEVDTTLVDEAAAEMKRRLQSQKARVLARSKLQKHLGEAGDAKLPQPAKFHGKHFFVEDGLSLPSNWHAALAQWRMVQTSDVTVADVFVVRNPWAPIDPQVLWCAKLQGLWTCVPDVVLTLGETGAAIQWAPAMSVRRLLWVSECFKDHEKHLWLLVAKVAVKLRNQDRAAMKWICVSYFCFIFIWFCLFVFLLNNTT